MSYTIYKLIEDINHDPEVTFRGMDNSSESPITAYAPTEGLDENIPTILVDIEDYEIGVQFDDFNNYAEFKLQAINNLTTELNNIQLSSSGEEHHLATQLLSKLNSKYNL